MKILISTFFNEPTCMSILVVIQNVFCTKRFSASWIFTVETFDLLVHNFHMSTEIDVTSKGSVTNLACFVIFMS